MPWAELWLLYVMAEHFNFKILYTPIIPYLSDFEAKKNGTYMAFLQPIKMNFSLNHIPYLKEKKFNEYIQFDHVGIGLAQQYANKSRWVKQLIILITSINMKK